MPDVGKELAALDFGNLIGGPLNAVITAQSRAAQSTADFIKTVGFYPADQPEAADGTVLAGTPVYVDFKYPKEITPFIPAIGKPTDTLLPPYVAGKAEVTSFTVALDASHATNFKVTGTSFETAWVGRKINSTLVTIASVESATAMTLSAAITTTSIVINEVLAVGNSNFPDGRPAYVPPVPGQYQEMKFSVPILTMLPIPFIKVDIITIDFNAKITSMETQSSSEDISGAASFEAKQRWPGGSAKLNVSAAYKKSTSSGSNVERTYSMAIHVQASQDEMPEGMAKLLGILESAMISTAGPLRLRHN